MVVDDAPEVHLLVRGVLESESFTVDTVETAAAAVREGDSSKKFAFFAVGVKGANMEVLSQISLREPLSLDGLRFRDMFKRLSSSLKSVSQSTPGTDVALTPPSGWTSV